MLTSVLSIVRSTVMVKNSELFEAAKKLKPNDVIEFRVLMRRPEID